MQRCTFPNVASVAVYAFSLILCLSSLSLSKEKNQPPGPDDLTVRLYQLLDQSYGGKLADFYVIADVFKNPKGGDQDLQRIFMVEYDKSKAFGKFTLHVRTVDKLTGEQLKNYTAKQIFEFAETDVERFSKTDPGSFGRVGDLYLLAAENAPLATAPVTQDVRKEYATYVGEWILPALEKK